MKCLLSLFFISGQLWAIIPEAHRPVAGSVTMTEDDEDRLAVINRLHQIPSCCGSSCLCYGMPPETAYLCCASDEAKQPLKELYYDNGPWETSDASKTQKALVWCRRKGCGVEHACCALTIGTAACLALSHASFASSATVLWVETVAALGLGPVLAREYDRLLSAPSCWPTANANMQMTEGEKEEPDIVQPASNSEEE